MAKDSSAFNFVFSCLPCCSSVDAIIYASLRLVQVMALSRNTFGPSQSKAFVKGGCLFRMLKNQLPKGAAALCLMLGPDLPNDHFLPRCLTLIPLLTIFSLCVLASLTGMICTANSIPECISLKRTLPSWEEYSDPSKWLVWSRSA